MSANSQGASSFEFFPSQSAPYRYSKSVNMSQSVVVLGSAIHAMQVANLFTKAYQAITLNSISI
jgi:hypothetical protein